MIWEGSLFGGFGRPGDAEDVGFRAGLFRVVGGLDADGPVRGRHRVAWNRRGTLLLHEGRLFCLGLLGRLWSGSSGLRRAHQG